MGIMEDLKAQQKSKKTKKQARTNNLVSFKPTKAEKEAIKQMDDSASEIIQLLGAFVAARDLKLSVGYDDPTGAYFVTIREKAEDWKRARGLSSWHANLETAFFSLAFALTGPHRDFPESAKKVEADDIDW